MNAGVSTGRLVGIYSVDESRMALRDAYWGLRTQHTGSDDRGREIGRQAGR